VENSKQGCLSVLAIESDSELCSWLSKQLELVYGVAEVRTVASVAAANALLTAWTPDLFVVDICTLPLDSVLPLITRIKRSQPRQRCIVTTLYDDSDELLLSLRAGADGYVKIDEDDALFIQQLQNVVLGRPPLTAKLARRLISEFGLQYRDELALVNCEMSVLELVASGLSVKRSAQDLDMSYEAIANTVRGLYGKLHDQHQPEAAA